MTVLITSCQYGPHGVATSFTAEFVQVGTSYRGSCEIVEILCEGATRLVRCLFNGWKEKQPFTFDIGFEFQQEDDAWQILHLDRAPPLVKVTSPPGATYDDNIVAMTQQLKEEDARFAPVERLFLLCHWLMMSAHLEYRLPGLRQDRIAWRLERNRLAATFGPEAMANPYAYALGRLASRSLRLIAEAVPWSTDLARELIERVATGDDMAEEHTTAWSPSTAIH